MNWWKHVEVVVAKLVEALDSLRRIVKVGHSPAEADHILVEAGRTLVEVAVDCSQSACSCCLVEHRDCSPLVRSQVWAHTAMGRHWLSVLEWMQEDNLGR